MEALIPIEAVVAAESHKRLVHSHGTAKKLDAVVQVGHNLNVMDGCARTDTGKGQAIDFVGCSQLGSTVADAHIRQHTGVVFVVVSTICGLIVVRGDALHLGGSAKVGGGVTQDNQAAPLATGVVRR